MELNWSCCSSISQENILALLSLILANTCLLLLSVKVNIEFYQGGDDDKDEDEDDDDEEKGTRGMSFISILKVFLN